MKLEDTVFAGQPLPLKGIMDLHTHMGRNIRFPIAGSDSDSMVRQMDRVGVERMVCAHQAVMSAEVVFGNNEVLKAMKRHPGRILGYAGVFPVNDRLGIEEAKRCLEAGMVGVKMHSVNRIPYTSESYAAIWEFADAGRLPVLLHTWGQIDSLEPVFSKYRKAQILLAHSGSTDVESYIRAARKFRNVYLELALSLSKYGLVEYFVEQVGSRKVVFGSDMPWISLGQQIGKVLFADITEAQKKDILVNNAARILKTKVELLKVL